MGVILNSDEESWRKRINGMYTLYESMDEEYGTPTPECVMGQMREIDKRLQAAFDLINDHSEMEPVHEESQLPKIKELEERLQNMGDYVYGIHNDLRDDLEFFIYEKLSSNMEKLEAASDLSRYSMENTLNIVGVDHQMTGNSEMLSFPEVESIQEVKKSIGFLDFMPFLERELPDGTKIRGEDAYCVSGFAHLYQKQWDKLKLSEGHQVEDASIDDYLTQLYYESRVHHQAEYTKETFLADVARVSILIPIIDAIRGTSLVTGNRLTDAQRVREGHTGFIGAVGFGISTVAGVEKGMSFLEALAYSSGNVIIGMASTGTGSLSREVAVRSGVRDELAGLLAAGISIGVAAKLSKWYNKSWDKNLSVQRLQSEQVKAYERFLKNGAVESLTLEELAGLEKVDDHLALSQVDYDEVLELRKSVEGNVKGAGEAIEATSKVPKPGDPDFMGPFTKADNHFINGDGIGPKKRGVLGAHNLDNFNSTLESTGFPLDDLKVGEPVPHPTIEGIYAQKYRVPAYDGRGNFLGFKDIPDPKTYYDPSVISDSQMLEWGREAMENGTINGRFVKGFSSKGLEFRGFYEDGKITNFFPKLPGE